MGFGKDFKFGDKVTQGSPIPKLKVAEGEIKYVTILSLEEARKAGSSGERTPLLYP